MNTRQRKLLIAVAAIVLLMLIYPPYQRMGGNGYVLYSGYKWITGIENGETIAAMTLLVQWIGVIVASAIGFVLLKD